MLRTPWLLGISLLLLASCGERWPAASSSDQAQDEKRTAHTKRSDSGKAGLATGEEHGRLGPSDGLADEIHVPKAAPKTADEETQAPQADPDALEPDPAWLAVNEQLLQDQRESVIAAHKGGHPERLSSMMAPTPFNRVHWARQPQAVAKAYASVAEPGRINLIGSQGQGDPVLTLLSDAAPMVDPRHGTRILVRVPPFAPVSVASADRVTFANELPYATVVADRNGLAVIDVTVPTGTVDYAHIAIASPVAADAASVLIDIERQ